MESVCPYSISILEFLSLSLHSNSLFIKINRTYLIYIYLLLYRASVMLFNYKKKISNTFLLIELKKRTMVINIYKKLFLNHSIRVKLDYTTFLISLWRDRAERQDFYLRLWLFFSPFLFSPKKRWKRKRRMNSKTRGQKSCLSARSIYCYFS